jgi:DNA recombination protein RmuC
MFEPNVIIAAILGFIAVLIAGANWFRSLRSPDGLTRESAASLIRDEHDRLRIAIEEQLRGLRSELSEGVRGLQDSSIRGFGELTKALEAQTTGIAERVEAGVGRIEKQCLLINDKLDGEFQKLGRDASDNRDRLRVAIEERLDKAAFAQAEAAGHTRTAVLESIQEQGRATTELLDHVGRAQKDRLDQFGVAIAKVVEQGAEHFRSFRTSVEERLEKGAVAQAADSAEARSLLLAAVQEQSKATTDLIRQIGDHLKEAVDKATSSQADAATEARGALMQNVRDQATSLSNLLAQMGEQQKERLDKVSTGLTELTTQQGEKLEAVRQVVEDRLNVLRQDNSQKLEEMRQTVDEKLKSTLEQRLGDSFNRVVEQLERVHAGIGEMKTLATGVGDLKKVLSNVSVRGALGEIQLARLLEQLLTPEQYIENAAVRDDGRERVEFAIRLPGRNDETEVLLPIDAKFPQEDYQRLLEAAERADVDAVAQAGLGLEQRIRAFARTVREKYIAPPRTTDFAVLFLPIEGLYAEVLRRPGLFEELQRDHHVTLAGPTTLTALLNALQMGFRSVAIERRSSEVWQVLGAVRTEFGKYNDVVERLGTQLGTAAKSVKSLGVRTRAMNRKLRSVETLPVPEATALLELGGASSEEEDDDRGEA